MTDRPDDDPPAPPGQVYVCGACGKTAPSRYALRDSSCQYWAVLCYQKQPHESSWTAVPEAKA